MSLASDAPVRPAGTHIRSGNAMLRTRAAILDATARCVEKQGSRKTTMSDVATAAKIAKATLYNHFRTKSDLLAGLVQARIEQLTSECAELAGAGLAPALQHAGRTVNAQAPLRRIAVDEPAVLAALGAPATGRLWDLARDGVRTVLRESGAPSGPVEVDAVLRWLCGVVMWPVSDEELALTSAVLASGLGKAPEPVVEATRPADPEPAVAGVGWPS